MKNVPTAEEFLNSKNYWHSEDYYPLLIEFAKLHCEAALKAASEEAELDYGNGSCKECGSNKIDEYSILTAYLLSNIK